MAFKQVFYALREVFPQVDLRILKAVASQYSSDVDAAVEFVLFDVLPAVSEPTEAHYTLQDVGYTEHGHSDSEKPKTHDKNILLEHRGATEDANLLPSPSSRSNDPIGDSNASLDDVQSSHPNKKLEECPQIEDKVVINESRGFPAVECAQAGSSLTPATGPLQMEYEASASRTFVNHCATENEKMGTTLLKAEHIDDHKDSKDNYELSELFASAGSASQFFIPSPLNCEMKYKGQMAMKFHEAENKCDISNSEDNSNMEDLFVNFYSTENDGHSSKDLPNVSSILELSKSEDNYHLQTLFENIQATDIAEQVLDVLPNAENAPQLDMSKDDYNLSNLFGKSCRDDNTTEVPRVFEKAGNEQYFHITDDQYNLLDIFASSKSIKNSEKVENEQYFHMPDNQYNLLDLFASSKSIKNSEKDNSHTIDNEEQSSIEFMRPRAVSGTCSLGDNFDLSELFCSTESFTLSALDSKYEARDQTEREILGFEIEGKQSKCPVVEHTLLVANGMKMIPGENKNDECVDISTYSDQIAQINEFISDVSKSKEMLISFYESTIIKMKEVELREESARQVKQAAVMSHQDFLAMLDNFNRLTENSKETNDKQTQIVREEKSSLATSAQELQSRLTNVSALRDKALTVIEESKLVLNARLTAALEQETAARKQICHEEKLAQLVRKEKEAIIESILEESRKIQKDVEENISLRGFLLDRSRMIDILQEEISNIYINVMALKEKTHRNKLKSALVASSSILTSSADTADSKSISVGDQSLVNGNQTGLPHGQMLGNHAGDNAISSDEEWEVL